MKKSSSFTKILTVTFFFLLAAVLTGYPFISNYVFEHQTESLVKTAERHMEKADPAQKEEMKKAAQIYNERIFNGYVQQNGNPYESEQLSGDDSYFALLNAAGDGMMGIVEIPDINVKLPIYHGTDEKTLEKGAGHLQGSSLPVGGESTHTVLTGHTGYSRARLFTDLTEMKEGNLILLYVPGEELVYEVDRICTVLPADVQDHIYPERGKDYCTLLTCAPYGANTHRLLVRGVRRKDTEHIENTEWIEHADTAVENPVRSYWMKEYRRALIISLSIFMVGLCVLLICRYCKRREKRRRYQRKKRNRKQHCQRKPTDSKGIRKENTV